MDPDLHARLLELKQAQPGEKILPLATFIFFDAIPGAMPPYWTVGYHQECMHD